MALVGYARISTAEGSQVMDRQLDALRAAGCRRVFEDRISGAKQADERLGLRDCLDWLREGVVLDLDGLDRLGRLAGELVQLIDGLAAREVRKRVPVRSDQPRPDDRFQLQRIRVEAADALGELPGSHGILVHLPTEPRLVDGIGRPAARRRR